MNLAEKIAKIEALIAGAKSAGERQAALNAKQRLEKKRPETEIEYSVSVDSPWKKQLFVALCHKHGLRTYRYARQKRTTTMVRIKKSFLNEVLWPEFKQYAKILDGLVEGILADLIADIHEPTDEIVISGELT